MKRYFSKLPPIFYILLLALILRLINIQGRDLWYDEAFAALFAEATVSEMIEGLVQPSDGGASDIHPILYFASLHYWTNIIGQSAVAVRLLSVLIGILTIYILYRLVQDLFDEKTALMSALITAIAPFHVQYSQEVRMYSLLVLFLMSLTWAFIKAWRETNTQIIKQFQWWIVFGVLAGLAMHTQQLAAFYLVAIGLVPFVSRRKQPILGVMIGAIIALLIYSPWLVNVSSQVGKVNSFYWIQPPNLGSIILTIRTFFTVFAEIPASLSILTFLLSLFLILFLLIQVFIYARQPRRKTNSDTQKVLFVLWLTVIPVALMWFVSQILPVYLHRALLGSALMLYVALAWMFTRSGLPRPIALILGVGGLILVGIGLWYHYTWDTFPNSAFREATQIIHSESDEHDIIVHMNKLSALPMIFYGEREMEQTFIADLPGSPEDTLAIPTQEILKIESVTCIQQISPQVERIWFVTLERAEREYRSANRPEFNQSVAWLEQNFNQMEKISTRDLNIYLYANPQKIRTNPPCGEVSSSS